jgi:hypothetical protein
LGIDDKVIVNEGFSVNNLFAVPVVPVVLYLVNWYIILKPFNRN